MLTIVEVDVLGDLVPRAVVEMPHLLLVLHHAGRLALLLILEGYVVLDRFKVFPMLENKSMIKAQSLKQHSLLYNADASRERGPRWSSKCPSQLLFVHQLYPFFPRTSGFHQVTAKAAKETQGRNSRSSGYQEARALEQEKQSLSLKCLNL